MPDNKQLIKRLRRIKHEAEETEGLLGNTRARVYGEAADTIERLEAEIEKLKMLVDQKEAVAAGCQQLTEEAEAKLATLEAERERDAAVLEALTSDAAKTAIAQALFLDSPHRRNVPPGNLPADWWSQVPVWNRREYIRDATVALGAALQHAQEQVEKGSE